MNNIQFIRNKKLIKKDFNKLGLAMLMKEIIANVVVIIFIYGVMLIQVMKNPGITHEKLKQILESGNYDGLMSIGAVIISFIPFIIYRGRKFFEYDLREEKRKFSLKTIVVCSVILLSANSFLVFFSNVLELGLNAFGLSANSALEDLDSLNQLTTSMIIYSCILGPIIEEFIYRGAILRSMQKYGNRNAILVSAILFGLMHGNFFQIFMGVGLGIILGYLATEYSIKLTILLHIINNVCVELFSQVSSKINRNLGSGTYFVFLLISVIILVICFITYKNSIKEWLKNNKLQKESMFKFATSILIIIVIIFDIYRVINGIKSI